MNALHCLEVNKTTLFKNREAISSVDFRAKLSLFHDRYPSYM